MQAVAGSLQLDRCLFSAHAALPAPLSGRVRRGCTVGPADCRFAWRLCHTTQLTRHVVHPRPHIICMFFSWIQTHTALICASSHRGPTNRPNPQVRGVAPCVLSNSWILNFSSLDWLNLHYSDEPPTTLSDSSTLRWLFVLSPLRPLRRFRGLWGITFIAL